MIPINSKTLTVGLGWQQSKCDLDAAIVLLDKMGNKIVALNAYSDYSKYPGIKHSGDKKKGEVNVDDETIILDFDKIDKNVDSIWPVIMIYTPSKNFTHDVEKAYTRIFDSEQNKEFVRIDLSENKDGKSNGNILANFKRCNGGWSFRGREYYTMNTNVANEMAPYCAALAHNVFSHDPNVLQKFSPGFALPGAK